MTTSQVLQEARRKIEGGWIKGIRFMPDAQGKPYYCLVGAIERGTAKKEEQQRALESLAASLCDRRGSCYPRIRLMRFNDGDRRTKQQVLALIDRALVEVTK